MATTIDPSAFPPPAYDIAFLYAQQANDQSAAADLNRRVPEDAEPLSTGPQLEDVAGVSFAGLPGAQSAPGSYDHPGHGPATASQDVDGMSAVGLNGQTAAADGGQPRPKRVRTGVSSPIEDQVPALSIES